MISQRNKAKLKWTSSSLQSHLGMFKQQRLRNNIKVQEKKQRKISFLLISMTVSFYLTWTPYAINSLLAMAGVSLPRTVIMAATLFAKTGTFINPILYIFFNKEVGINIYIKVRFK